MTELVCIVCPNSCKLTIDANGKVTGNKCKRGEKFAMDEMTCPMRSVTTTVATKFDDVPVVSVRTNGEIPKGKMFELMKVLNKVVLEERVKRGSVVIENVLGTGVDIITTSDMVFDY